MKKNMTTLEMVVEAMKDPSKVFLGKGVNVDDHRRVSLDTIYRNSTQWLLELQHKGYDWKEEVELPPQECNLMMPEKIWAHLSPWSSDPSKFYWTDREIEPREGVWSGEYLRLDIHAAEVDRLRAEKAELLEALENALNYLDRQNGQVSLEVWKANYEPMQVLRAAIAKARGTCPSCGHQAHGEVCYNFESDNDCSCTFGQARGEK